MEITEVRLTRVKGDDKLKAFVSITFDDDFVVRDLKVIKGKKGEFVAMPSRKLTEHCPECGKKNDVLSAYCNTCGKKLPRQDKDRNKRVYADIAHPINTQCRELIQEKVLEEYKKMRDKQGEDTEEDTDSGDFDRDPLDIQDEEEENIGYAPDEDESEESEDEEDNDQDSSESSKDDDDDFSAGIW